MASASWRGDVGVVKPTYGSGSLIEFIRLLPEGIVVIPLFAGIKEHTEKGYLEALDSYHARVAELAEIGVDLIHPEGAPPFLVRGYKAEQEIVKGWEEKYGIPIVTSGMTQSEALRAMKIKKFVGVTYYKDRRLNEMFARYFLDAGFEVVAMEGLQVEAGEWGDISAQEIYISIKKCFLKHREAQGIYLLGSGAWRVADVVPVEEDLGVPVIHPVAARVYCVQRMMHIRQPVKGASRLLEEMP